jgi:hypothetical protein
MVDARRGGNALHKEGAARPHQQPAASAVQSVGWWVGCISQSPPHKLVKSSLQQSAGSAHGLCALGHLLGLAMGRALQQDQRVESRATVRPSQGGRQLGDGVRASRRSSTVEGSAFEESKSMCTRETEELKNDAI